MNEVDTNNQESVSWDSNPDRMGGSRDPQLEYAKGKKLRIVKSVDPTLAARPKIRYTKKPPYKRD